MTTMPMRPMAIAIRISISDMPDMRAGAGAGERGNGLRVMVMSR